MRSMLLTTVAAAGLGMLPFQTWAQDRNPSTQRQQSSPMSEPSRAPESQQKGMQGERSGTSAAEPNQSGAEVHGKSQNRSAQEELKSKNKSSREAHPAQGAENQNTEKGSMRKPSASTEPVQPGQAKKQRHGEVNPAATETERTPRHTMRSNAPNKAEPQNEPRRPEGSTIGGNQIPNKAATGGSAAGGTAMPARGKDQRQGAAVTLNSQQETSVFAALRSEQVQRLDRVDFSLTVGTIIPTYVSLNPLPESIVDIVPQYSGYDFAMVRDEIIIVEPRTRHIVTVLRGQGRSAATAGHSSAARAAHGHLQFTGEQRQLIRRDLLTSEGVALDSVEIGERVPADVSLISIPADVLDEVPDISSYRYFVASNQVVIVEPDTREVVDIIE